MSNQAQPPFVTAAPHRALLRLSGEQTVEFLQGLLSNDIAKASDSQGLWTALLSPQGKFLHDIFVLGDGQGGLLLEAEADRLADLHKRLKLYRLRSKVEITPLTDWSVALLWGAQCARTLGLPSNSTGTATALETVGPEPVRLLSDPRLANAGVRAYLPPQTTLDDLTAKGFTSTDFAVWDSHRISLGLPDGSRDLQVDKALLLESGFDELGGLDWKKGCYVGQELTARTRYRGLVKKRLLSVTFEGPAPESGAQILLNGKDAGTFYSHQGQQGLALLRLTALDQAEPGQLTSGEAKLTAQVPAWTILPQPPVT